MVLCCLRERIRYFSFFKKAPCGAFFNSVNKPNRFNLSNYPAGICDTEIPAVIRITLWGIEENLAIFQYPVHHEKMVNPWYVMRPAIRKMNLIYTDAVVSN